jgi:hypothetical protein
MSFYTDAEIVVHHITALIGDNDPELWRGNVLFE